MGKDVERFKIKDDSGEKQEYKVTLHAPMDGGLEVVNKLLEVLTGPASKLVRAFSDGNLGLDREINDILDEANFEKELRKTVQGLDPGFIFKLFKNARRSGTDLDDRRSFNKAFKGNYGEMLEAAYRIIRYNGFLSSVYTRLQGRMEQLARENEEIDPEQIVQNFSDK